jgi:hypothetical protein
MTTTIPVARCANHKQRAVLPALCHTCQRINVEHEIVRRLVMDFLAAGYQFGLDYGDGPETPSQTLAGVLRIAFDVDDCYLLLTGGNAGEGWVRLVFGNDGYDVISDYTTNLEGLVAPVMQFAATFEP